MVPPTVYVREDSLNRTRFHKDKECFQLRKRPARGPGAKLLEVDLRELSRVVPCKTCYPDVPRVKMARRRCTKCKGAAHPCAHNGGVPVWITVTTTYRSLLREPGDTMNRLIYVWPDRAHLYYTSN